VELHNEMVVGEYVLCSLSIMLQTKLTKSCSKRTIPTTPECGQISPPKNVQAEILLNNFGLNVQRSHTYCA